MTATVFLRRRVAHTIAIGKILGIAMWKNGSRKPMRRTKFSRARLTKSSPGQRLIGIELRRNLSVCRRSWMRKRWLVRHFSGSWIFVTGTAMYQDGADRIEVIVEWC
jgi:hypothetical protein